MLAPRENVASFTQAGASFSGIGVSVTRKYVGLHTAEYEHGELWFDPNAYIIGNVYIVHESMRLRTLACAIRS